MPFRRRTRDTGAGDGAQAPARPARAVTAGGARANGSRQTVGHSQTVHFTQSHQVKQSQVAMSGGQK
ncbi:hypothetical protein GCM10020358_61260 [Amorphoplanes nipponensis]|uniref:Uncharacterized protein n=1 Tax=Actinoplanes nipponensis TaxID=135950 RepID=A0A919MLG5_9ACTN|nr:hypothetical protein Ani05nite_74630 [Actinoplanes nipponensis]